MAPLTHTNPLVSTQRTSDNVPAVLHPLVLLGISDNITRHTLRGNTGPVVGALLGQQNGRQVTIEHTFDFNVMTNPTIATEATFDGEWFEDRILQMRQVHADRHLDLVGWYTVLSRDGPTPKIQQIHKMVQRSCRESTAAVLLAFHPEDLEEQTVGGRLPLTLYETHYEQDDELSAQKTKQESTPLPTQSRTLEPEKKSKEPEKLGGDDKEMTDAVSSPSLASRTADEEMESQHKPTSEYLANAADGMLPFKFREIAYTVETEEAERISIDFVARGVANASSAAVAGDDRKAAGKEAVGKGGSSSTSPRDRAVAIESGNRGKRRLVAADDSTPLEESSSGPSTAAAAAATAATADVVLSREDEELISTLTTRANAIRMLHARLQLLTRYLEALPANAVEEGGRVATADDRGGNDASNDGTGDPSAGAVGVSLPILRSIQALVQRLPLVVPPPVNGAFEEEQQREANDVQLASLLLDDVMQSIGRVRQTGGKLAVFMDGAPSRNHPGGGSGATSAAARAALYRANSGGPSNAGRSAAGASRQSAYHTVS